MSAQGESEPAAEAKDAPAAPEETRKRSKERVEMRVAVEFRGRRTRGHGFIRNISESGALVEDAEPLVVAGGRIRLRFAFFEDSLPVEIPAAVVRETASGFGVQFSGLDARLKSVLALVIARIRNRNS
ncbi:MAG TPA: PilZ domain-containing protein [Myxococcota bacterium]|nr:PilZ domain-containing protein [Myxococcota bacterium]